MKPVLNVIECVNLSAVTEFPHLILDAGTVFGAWWTAYNSAYLKANTDGSGGAVANGAPVARWDDRVYGNPIVQDASVRGAVFNALRGLQTFAKANGNTTDMRCASLSTSLTSNAMTGGAVIDFAGSSGNAIDLSSGGHTFSFEPGGLGSPEFTFYGDSTPVVTPLRCRTRRSCISWRSSSAGFDIYVDGVLYAGAALGAFSLSTVRIGTGSLSHPEAHCFKELVLFDTVLSDTLMADFNLYLRAQAQSADGQRTVDIIGDQLTLGFGSETGCPWHARPEMNDRPNSVWRVSAYPGATLYASTPITATRLLADRGVVEAVVHCYIGTNDIVSGGQSAAGLYADVTAYASACRGAGIKFIGYCLQDVATNRAVKNAFNALMIAGHANFDALVRLDDQLPDCTNSTYFSPADPMLLLDAGYAVLANAANTAQASL